MGRHHRLRGRRCRSRRSSRRSRTWWRKPAIGETICKAVGEAVWQTIGEPVGGGLLRSALGWRVEVSLWSIFREIHVVSAKIIISGVAGEICIGKVLED